MKKYLEATQASPPGDSAFVPDFVRDDITGLNAIEIAARIAAIKDIMADSQPYTLKTHECYHPRLPLCAWKDI